MSSSHWLVASLLAVSSSAFAEARVGAVRPTLPELDTPIVGGTLVPPGKWPDAVAVMGQQGSCTGTLIAPDVVLTAGHCADAAPSEVIANTTDYEASGGVRARVQSVTAYPNWENTFDVAVVKLATPITGVTPRPVGTSCTFQGFTTNTQVQLVGFGLIDANGAIENTKLREVRVPVTDPTCSGGNGCVPGAAPAGEFVAGGNGIDSCNGDSGGPVYLDTPRGTMVIAAVSRGVESASTPCGEGGIYVRTDKIVQWIEQTVGHAVAKDECTGSGSGGSGTGEEETPSGEEPGQEDDDNPDVPSAGGPPPEITGGCNAGGGASASGLALGIVLAVGALRRRR
jgi:secreted trypsin-like serine protease